MAGRAKKNGRGCVAGLGVRLSTYQVCSQRKTTSFAPVLSQIHRGFLMNCSESYYFRCHIRVKVEK
jgi:hypothetical protein